MWGKYSAPASRLSVLSLGVAFGVAYAIWLAVAAWTGWGSDTSMMRDLSSFYPGYAVSVKGGFIGAVWGFVEGFIFGVILGWVYNLGLCCCKGCKRPEDDPKL